MNKLILELKNFLKLEKENALFVVVMNHKFLLGKWLKEKILLKEENVKIITVHLCQNQHGLIQIVSVIYFN